MHKLRIENLVVEVDGEVILNGFNLEIKSGEIHTIMGPNGTGKSTLCKVIMGDDTYKVVSGSIYFDDKELNNLSVDERARAGIFLGMQLPTEIEGVTNADFMRTALHLKEGDNFKLMSFIREIKSVCAELKMDEEMIHRGVNKGFSGGEKKKNEILHLYVLEPKLILLDELDSGLDVDSLKSLSAALMDYKDETVSILIITHHTNILEYIKPDKVSILSGGSIVKEGDASLAREIETSGFSAYEVSEK